MPSNNAARTYYRKNFLGKVKRPFDQEVPDPLSQKLLDLVENIPTYKVHMYSADETFTTLVYRAYGSTSLWWLVLLYNGLFSPLDLMPGMVINFPDKRAVDEAIRLVNAKPKDRNLRKVVI